MNVFRHIKMCQANKGEDFHISEVYKEVFADFKLSPACTQFQHYSKDITTIPPPSLGSNYSIFKIIRAMILLHLLKEALIVITHSIAT